MTHLIESLLYFWNKKKLEVNANLLLIIIGVVLYLAILSVSLAFCRIGARTDRKKYNSQLTYLLALLLAPYL